MRWFSARLTLFSALPARPFGAQQIGYTVRGAFIALVSLRIIDTELSGGGINCDANRCETLGIIGRIAERTGQTADAIRQARIIGEKADRIA